MISAAMKVAFKLNCTREGFTWPRGNHYYLEAQNINAYVSNTSYSSSLSIDYEIAQKHQKDLANIPLLCSDISPTLYVTLKVKVKEGENIGDRLTSG